MSNQEQTIEHYLLGEMPEAECVALEEQYFSDERLFERIVQVEHELVDKYARGLLPSAVRDRFEKHYLAHPQRRERAKFAEALATKIGQQKAIDVATSEPTERWRGRLSLSRGPGWAWAFSIALVSIAVVAGWFLIETKRLRQELATTESERSMREQRERELEQQVTNEQQRAQALSEELDRLRIEETSPARSPERATKGAPTFATLMLTIGRTRTADTGPPAVLLIPAGTEQARLQLNLRENDYSSYEAVLQSAGGAEVFRWRRLTPRISKPGSTLVMVMPAAKLASGDYILTLRGSSKTGEVEDVNKSLFRVERK